MEAMSNERKGAELYSFTDNCHGIGRLTVLYKRRNRENCGDQGNNRSPAVEFVFRGTGKEPSLKNAETVDNATTTIQPMAGMESAENGGVILKHRYYYGSLHAPIR